MPYRRRLMNVNVVRLISTTVTVITVPPVTAATVHEFLLFGRRVAKRYLRMPIVELCNFIKFIRFTIFDLGDYLFI